jgi:hypothetical protein
MTILLSRRMRSSATVASLPHASAASNESARDPADGADRERTARK